MCSDFGAHCRTLRQAKLSVVLPCGVTHGHSCLVTLTPNQPATTTVTVTIWLSPNVLLISNPMVYLTTLRSVMPLNIGIGSCEKSVHPALLWHISNPFIQCMSLASMPWSSNVHLYLKAQTSTTRLCAIIAGQILPRLFWYCTVKKVFMHILIYI